MAPQPSSRRSSYLLCAWPGVRGQRPNSGRAAERPGRAAPAWHPPRHRGADAHNLRGGHRTASGGEPHRLRKAESGSRAEGALVLREGRTRDGDLGLVAARAQLLHVALTFRSFARVHSGVCALSFFFVLPAPPEFEGKRVLFVLSLPRVVQSLIILDPAVLVDCPHTKPGSAVGILVRGTSCQIECCAFVVHCALLHADASERLSAIPTDRGRNMHAPCCLLPGLFRSSLGLDGVTFSERSY